LPAIAPRVLSDSAADETLKTLARLKQPGVKNMVLALSYNEALPAELPSVPTMLESLLVHLVPSGIRYLPWDYFNATRAPIFFAKNTGIANPAVPVINVPEGGDPQEALANSGFTRLMMTLKNRDGTLPRFLRLRIDVTVDKDIRAVNRGVILRALAQIGSQYAEGNLDIDNDEAVSRITVTLTLLNEAGDLNDNSVVVTADVVRLGAGDRLGVIVAGNGVSVYEKATGAHGMAAAMRETLGHAVFVLVCKLLDFDHEKVLAQCGHRPERKSPAPPTPPASLAKSMDPPPAPAPAGSRSVAPPVAAPPLATAPSATASSAPSPSASAPSGPTPPASRVRVTVVQRSAEAESSGAPLRKRGGITSGELVDLGRGRRFRLANGAVMELVGEASRASAVLAFYAEDERGAAHKVKLSSGERLLVENGASSSANFVELVPPGRSEAPVLFLVQ
jgi:hypothetical protein